jgi:hypothetical protein
MGMGTAQRRKKTNLALGRIGSQIPNAGGWFDMHVAPLWHHLMARNAHGELSRGRNVNTGFVKMEFERFFSHSLSPACLAPS